MTAFAILRIEKHKSLAALMGVARHHFREVNCPTANPLRTPKNMSWGAKSSKEVGARIDRLIKEAQAKSSKKFRSDSVKAIEYLLTASPEWWKTATQKNKVAFFDRARRFLREKHGSQNIVCEWLHLDERTPHLSVVVAPLHDGKLNAKHYLGGHQKLAELQDGFAKVMEPLGLVRGIRRSESQHLPVSDWWAALNAPNPKPSKGDYLKKAMGLPSPVLDLAERKASAYEANKRTVEAIRAKAAGVAKLEKDNALEAGFLASERQKIQEREARASQVERENLRLREQLVRLAPHQPGGYLPELGLV